MLPSNFSAWPILPGVGAVVVPRETRVPVLPLPLTSVISPVAHDGLAVHRPVADETIGERDRIGVCDICSAERVELLHFACRERSIIYADVVEGAVEIPRRGIDTKSIHEVGNYAGSSIGINRLRLQDAVNI